MPLSSSLIAWLLASDVAIQYQTGRDLLATDDKALQERIATEGWGAQFLAKRRPDGHWGQKFYQPKWTSSHYTLLDLRNLGFPPDHPLIRESIRRIVATEKGPDGGIKPIGANMVSDVCVNGMFLNYAAYFRTDAAGLESVVDFILSQYMPDGGFNCRSNRSGAVHSSLHTTLSVLEGFEAYIRNGYTYRLDAVQGAKASSIEFVLLHRLYLSDRTGEIIDPLFLKLAYPCRWRYDILRALDYFQYAEVPWDERMRPALNILLEKRTNDGTWKLPAKHPGAVHFEMEQAGKASRWNTLRALRVLKAYGQHG